MQIRIVELSMAMVVGMATWWYWEPTQLSIKLGLIAYGIVLICCQHTVCNRLILLLMALLLGSLRMSSIQNHTDRNDTLNSYTTGWVIKSNHRQALVENDAERWKIDFYPKAPKQGSLVSVWHQPKLDLVDWEGGINRIRRSHAERTGLRKAKDWIVHVEPDRLEKPIILEDLKHGGVLWALISGDKSGIDSNTKNMLRKTGTSHLLAISGMHIGLMATFTYWVIHTLLGWMVWVDRFERCNIGSWVKRVALLSSMIVSIWYGHQVGWPASAQRAVVMVSIFCVGKGMELSFSLWDVLGLTATLMLIKEPSLIHDLGFQLSFSAVAGIGLFGSMAHRLTSKSQSDLMNGVILSIGMTIGATLGTIPICAWIFQSIPLTGVVANLLVTPFMATLAVPISMIGLVCGQLEYSLIEMGCFVLADVCVDVSLWLLAPFVIEPFAVAFDTLDVWVCSLCILGMGLLHPLWCRSLGFVGLLVLLYLNSPHGAEYHRSDHDVFGLRISFLPVGQGDASLLEWGDGEVWLIDGGPFTFDMVPYLKRQGIWHIEKIWLSHPHADHMEGIVQVIENLGVGVLIVGRNLEKEDEGGRYSALWDLARSKHIPIQIAETVKDTVELQHRGVQILHPHDWTVATSDRCNEESVVLEITIGDHKVLFPGDIEEDAEEHLLDVVSAVDVLKVPHHGSSSSSSSALMALLKPKYSVISVGRGNRFGHPHAKALWSLKGSKILRTDWHGMVQVTFQNGRMHVDR